MPESPQKPWETGNLNQATSNITQTPNTTASSITQPDIPPRPVARNTNLGVSNFGGISNGYGYSGYGGYGSNVGGFNNYGYGMNRYSGYGGYGGYGTGMRYGQPYNRMGPMGPEGELSYVQQMEQATQPTFMLLDSIVQTFGGFAQMLESTFFATQSSFMAMVGVADQFSQIKNMFSIVSIWRTLVKFAYRLIGKTAPVDPSEISVEEFKDFADTAPKPSKKPIIFFFAMVFGLPWLMSKLIKKIEESRPKDLASLPPSEIQGLEFCKAKYDFNAQSHDELSIKTGELVAVLSKLDPHTNAPSEWWRGRTQDGRIGLFPGNYVDLIPKTDIGNSNVVETAPLAK